MKTKPHVEKVRDDLLVPKRNADRFPVRRSGSQVRRIGTSFTVNQEVKDWLKEMVKNHWYLFEHREHGHLCIAFHDHNDALRYKLAWH